MGALVALVGPTCSGKSTIEKRLEEWGYKRLISFTTRPPRSTEVDGREYHFVSTESAQSAVNSGRTLQHIEFNGNIYGTFKDDMLSLTEKGARGVIVVEPNGVNNIRAALLHEPWGEQINFQAVYIETIQDVLLKRLADRLDSGDVSEKEYNTRMDSLVREIELWPYIARYNFHLFNNSPQDLDRVVIAIDNRVNSLLS